MAWVQDAKKIKKLNLNMDSSTEDHLEDGYGHRKEHQLGSKDDLYMDDGRSTHSSSDIPIQDSCSNSESDNTHIFAPLPNRQPTKISFHFNPAFKSNDEKRLITPAPESSLSLTLPDTIDAIKKFLSLHFDVSRFGFGLTRQARHTDASYSIHSIDRSPGPGRPRKHPKALRLDSSPKRRPGPKPKPSSIQPSPKSLSVSMTIRSRFGPNPTCASCHTTRTPYWRDAWNSGVLLCNACGLRFAKFKRRCPTCYYVPRKEDKGGRTCTQCGDTWTGYTVPL